MQQQQLQQNIFVNNSIITSSSPSQQQSSPQLISSSTNNSIRRQHQPHIKTQQLPNGDSRVIRSEVWNCFDLDGLNAVCRACNERLKVGPTRQTSSLWRHLKRHSREVQDRLIKSWAESGLSSRSTNRMVERLQNGGTIGINQRRRDGQLFYENNSPYNSNKNTNFASSSSSVFTQKENNNNCESFTDTSGPLVTVDCKPGQSLDLEQLLGFQQNSNNRETTINGEISTSKLVDNEIDGMDYEEENEATAKSEKDQENFERAIVEFLLENALSFTKVLLQSPTFGEVLRLFCCSPIYSSNNIFRPIIPSPEPLLTGLVPKMFIEALDERKAHFEDDFFVLVLRRIRVENVPKGNTSILRISAIKLSESFGLCSRCLGVFAFRGGLRRLRDALRRCFEEGSIQLKLWQVSAVVHDGSLEFEELCHQLDIPGILSAPLMLRNIFSELDKLQFSAECVRRVKNKFEQTIGNILDGMHFSAFSISVPLLIEKTDSFCNQNILNKKEEEEKEKEEDQKLKIKKELLEEQRLLDKFRTLWIFQREKLLSEQTAKMSIFLNPNCCKNLKGPFTCEQWKKVEVSIIEEICQACLPLKPLNVAENVVVADDNNKSLENEDGEFKQRIEIEAEVNSYVDAALNEVRKGEEEIELNNNKQQQQSLSELLLWWRTNLERFPRVGHLARQFCAIPLCVENEGNKNIWKKEKNFLNNNDQKNANYIAELLNTDLAGERDDYSADMLIVSQLLTVRTTVLEKNGCSTVLLTKDTKY